MDHAGTEVGQLARFGVREAIDEHRFRHHARVGGEHALHVAPHMQLRGAEQRRKDGAGIVAAVAAKRGDASRDGACHEAGHDDAFCRPGQDGAQAFGTGIPAHHGAQIRLVHHQHLARIKPLAGIAASAHRGVHHARGPHLAKPRHQIQQIARDRSHPFLRLQQFAQAVELGLQECQRVGGVCTQQFLCGVAVAGVQRLDGLLPTGVARGGLASQRDQGIRHAPHGRDGDHLTLAARQQDVHHARDARGVRHAAASELVGDHGASLVACATMRRLHHRLPRFSCSSSSASNRALKLPLPKLWLPRRQMISKNRVGRSCSGLVNSCSR